MSDPAATDETRIGGEDLVPPSIDGLETLDDEWAGEIGRVEYRVESHRCLLEDTHLLADLAGYFGNPRHALVDWDEDWRPR